MILLDANLLVYARVSDFPEHEAAREWLDARLNGVTGVALPWASLLAFVRLVTNPRIFHTPMPTERAWDQVREWTAHRPAWIPVPTERHSGLLEILLPYTAGRPNLIPDAHLAALAMEYGLVLQSTDHDFARFPALRWENPLAPRNLDGVAPPPTTVRS